jgi:hypothetical protein
MITELISGVVILIVLRNWECFHRFPATLGAAKAGSRVVVHAGFLPRSRQVGASVVQDGGKPVRGVSPAEAAHVI